MLSYINIGSYVDEGIDGSHTWSTVGSRAQIGKNVHLSGGVGIGGVLNRCRPRRRSLKTTGFIGARSEVVEGWA